MNTRAPERIQQLTSHIDPRTNAQWDSIVIGGGINGVSTALALAKAKQRVLLLEQFELGHTNGSSHGDGRIIRFAYPERVYLEMARVAYKAWRDIEAETGQKLIHITGGVDFGPKDHPDVQNVENNLKANGVEYEALTSEESNKRFPMFHLDPNMRCVYQKDSGVVYATKAVKTIWELAATHGAKLMEHKKVKGLKAVSDSLVVVTLEDGSSMTSKSVVVTAGAWMRSLLERELGLLLPVTVTGEVAYYFKRKAQSKVDLTQYSMPIFITHGDDNYYGLPQIEVTGIKIGWHHSGPLIDVTSDAARNFDPENEKRVCKYISAHFPEVDLTPNERVECLYTSTTDHHFIIDRHPKHRNVIIGSACSGHGFKFGPVTGCLLADLAMNQKTEFPIDQFAIGRFNSRTTKRTGV